MAINLKLGTDSGEYDILFRAAQQAAKSTIPGLSIELGLREGGGSQYMIEAFIEANVSVTHVAIDPYGSLPYEWKQGEIANWVYDNSMRNQALAALYMITKNTPINFVFFNLTDAQFFDKFSTGVPVFENGGEKVIENYSIVHFDAIHSVEAILFELEFFIPRTTTGSVLVFDDVEHFYDHSIIETKVIAAGFKILEKGHKKASYIKI